MTALAARPIVMSAPASSHRKRARRFWGAMGASLRFDDRRNARADARMRAANGMLVVRMEALSWRS